MQPFIFQVDFGTPAFDEALALRDLVLRQPLKLDFECDDIAAEYDEIHLVACAADMTIIGSLTLRVISDAEIKMRQVAVHPNHHRQGIGAALVKASEEYARQQQFTLMSLHARDVAIPFYEQLQYKVIGDSFEEVNIPHHKMIKEL